MIRTPLDERVDEEIPISPTPDSSVTGIFSRKKIFFINSSFSGSRRSDIPHIESDYCPRDHVNRRLFNDRNNFCDCNSCWRCVRRNRQWLTKSFLIGLNIILVGLLFVGLYKSLSVYKKADKFPGKDTKHKWMSHDHYYDISDENHIFIKTLEGSTGKPESPVPVYEAQDDYDFHDDSHKHKYNIIKTGREKVELLPKLFLDKLNLNLADEPLIIYDNREPKRVRRAINPRSKNDKSDLVNTQHEQRKLVARFRKNPKKRKSKYGAVIKEINDALEGMDNYKESFNKNARTVFQPFSLSTPVYYTPLQSDEYSIEENVIEEELKNRFLDPLTLKENDEESTIKPNMEKNEELMGRHAEENALFELMGITVGGRDDDWEPWNGNTMTVLPAADESIIYTTEHRQTGPSPLTFEDSVEKVTVGVLAGTQEEISTLPDSLRITPEQVATTETIEKDEKSAEADDSEYRTFSNIPLIHVALPFAGLFGSSIQDERPADGAQSDRVKGISLAEAKEMKNSQKKHLLLNSRVVAGSSDLRLPTGPDFSKALDNAFESLKTNQQLSFTPSATSQYILPYQMCFFAGPVPGLRPAFQNIQPRTFSFKPPSLGGESQGKSLLPFPPPQNFLSFSINNYANPPPFRQTIPSGNSYFNFPPQSQFWNGAPFPNKQPIFCTYLRPPLFQFPTVPGTADFSHAKCVDCEEDFGREKVSFLSRETMCSDDSISCRDKSSCIPVGNWCDNEVHCKDASDEAFCSCRDRVVRERLCDGYVDCPHGEDEVGCFDCPKSAFSCDSVVSPDSCISMSKRCDGLRDCSTGADESECSALFFHMRQNDSYHVSQTNGFLHRNWKGAWFPVCVEIGDNSWAKEACLEELGFLPREVHVSYQPVPGNYKGPFIVRQEDGTPFLQNHCKGHVTTYVKCPSMRCGTRVEFPNLREFDTRFRRFIQNDVLVDDVPFVTWWNNLKKNATKGFPVNRIYGKVKVDPEAKADDDRLKREETGRVVGGRASEPRAWPWAIALYKNGAFHCGGVILDEKWILTAAHCMEQYWKSYFEVRGGMLRRFSFSAMEQIRPVTHVIIHENYNPMIMSNDIAVLRLKEPFHFNRWLRPACLPSLEVGVSKFLWGPVPGTRCIAVGWGALKERGSDPDQLREVEVPILNRCKHKEDLAGAEICAGKIEGGKDTCQGDSGGPLLCRDSGTPSSWYVAGIVSHGEGCARPGEPGAYTRISLFIDWITANTNDFQLPSIKPLRNCPGFRCSSGSRLCISVKWVCNGFTDCLEAEDEKNCNSSYLMSQVFGAHYGGKLKSVNFQHDRKYSKSVYPIPTAGKEDESDTTEAVEEIEKEISTNKLEEKTTGSLPKTSTSEELEKVEEVLERNRLEDNFSTTELSMGKNLISEKPPLTSFEKDLNSKMSDTSSEEVSENKKEEITFRSVESKEEENTIGEEGLREMELYTLYNVQNDPKEEGVIEDENEESKEVEVAELYIPEQVVKNLDSFEEESDEETQKPTDRGSENDKTTEDISDTTLNPSSHSIQPRETLESTEEGFTDVTSSTDEPTARMAEGEKKSSAHLEFFRCEKIVQTISRKYRCNGNLDCEDGTDEENCSCAERLLYSNPSLICNGRIECADLSDEKTCSNCSADEFYCRKSRECIALSERCNGLPKCRFEEDELNCFALTKNSKIELQADGEPTFHTKGTLVSNENGVWASKCQNGTTYFGATEAVEVCTGLGTIGYETYGNKTLSNDCIGFEVTCADNLISSLEIYGSEEKGYVWPWNAFVYSDGNPICSAALLRLDWLLTAVYCLKNVNLQKNYLVAKLGSKRPTSKVQELGTQLVRIDGVRHVPHSDMVLLHLSREAVQSRFVRPIGIPYLFDSDPEKDLCLAVRERTVFLKMSEDCPEGSRCYRKMGQTSTNCKSKPWGGVIACQSRLGWYPSSVFVEKAGYCGFRDAAFSSVQEKIDDIQSAMSEDFEVYQQPPCKGVRCSEGFCLPPDKVCDGWPHCGFKEDEDPTICSATLGKGKCKFNELKCHNGKCIPKALFGDGINDCGDNSDEPANATCLDYLRLTAPQRICDGRRNCYDKTDENPELCPCDDFKFECKQSQGCVPKDFVCDGEMDCPLGEDEDYCVTRKTIRNRSEIMKNSYGLWHSVCFPGVSKKLSDALCQDLGFREALFTFEKNQTILVPKVDAFASVKLNRETSIGLRGDRPFARLVKAKRLCTDVKCA